MDDGGEANPTHAPQPAVLAYAAREPRWYRVRVARVLLVVWLPLGVVAMGLALYGCREYNRIAGTDLTRAQIAGVVASVHLGPFAGPVNSSGGLNEAFYQRLAPIPLVPLFVAWVVVLGIRRGTRWPLAAFAWLLQVVAAAAWYGAAILSLAYWLS